jgi:probable phosphoglycerate mutase
MDGIPLSDEGLEQARAAGRALATVRLAALYSSPIERCAQTAAEIALACGLQVELRDGLNEVEYGRWTNRSFRSVVRTKLWEQVQRFPSAARFPDGESLFEVQARAIAEVERIAAAHPRKAVGIVTHADVIRLVAAHYLGLHIDMFQRLTIGPASTSVIGIGRLGPRVFALNVSPGGALPFAEGRSP